MRSKIQSSHFSNSGGNPEGGNTFGNGFAISWQRGPLGRPPQREEPNGAFVEDIIAAAQDRLEHYQNSKFKCDENGKAIEHLKRALELLDMRTKRREDKGTEGTHQGN